MSSQNFLVSGPKEERSSKQSSSWSLYRWAGDSFLWDDQHLRHIRIIPIKRMMREQMINHNGHVYMFWSGLTAYTGKHSNLYHWSCREKKLYSWQKNYVLMNVCSAKSFQIALALFQLSSSKCGVV